MKKNPKLEALFRVLSLCQWHSMITVKAPGATDKDEKMLSRKLRDLLKNAIGKDHISFVEVREFSLNGVLHWHIVFDRNLSSDLVKKLRKAVLRLLKEKNLKRHVFLYQDREDANLDWPRFYVAKTEKDGFPVKAVPEDWDASLLGPPFYSHRVRRTDIPPPSKEWEN